MSDDLIVVVPGITGSVLSRPDGSELWSRAPRSLFREVSRLSSALSELRLPEGIGDGEPELDRRLAATGLINGWHVWPGVHVGAGYHGVTALLRGRFPGTVRFFPYDWRLSNRHTARILAGKVGHWLTEHRERTQNPDAMVIFVCHSMGGLVARYFIEVLGGRETTRRLFTLGTPYSGSVKALQALTGDGYERIPRVGSLIAEAARSFPSLHQLLPTYHCVEAHGEALTLTDSSLTGLESTMVRDGAAFHAEMAAAVTRNGPPSYEMHVLAGKRQGTLQSVRVDGAGTREYLQSQRGSDHSGDGTVASFAAVPPEWADTAAATLVAVRHGAFTADSGALETLIEKLSPTRLGAVLLPDCELGLNLPDVVRARDGIPVVVTTDRTDLRLVATVADPGSDPVAESPVESHGDGVYSTTLPAPAGLWEVTVTAVAEIPPVRIADMVWVVD
jgi:hypothetical protein